MNIWQRLVLYALSCVFILSGVSKAVNIPAFAYEVRMYSDAYLMDGIGYWSQPILFAICITMSFLLRPSGKRMCDTK